ncbi:MAG: hypothetical protein KKB34_05075 [Bacteroidetes bacterium]|jgi:uncharacterized protein involved in exopolysaccharide biosynthesis|nr:hypothetical protein [Bacteroidota bacterium]
MSDQAVRELEKQGFLLIKKVHIWLIVLSILIAGITNVAIAFEAIKDHESRITLLEENGSKRHDLLNEIKYNLKNYMEANGQKYIELK